MLKPTTGHDHQDDHEIPQAIASLLPSFARDKAWYNARTYLWALGPGFLIGNRAYDVTTSDWDSMLSILHSRAQLPTSDAIQKMTGIDSYEFECWSHHFHSKFPHILPANLLPNRSSWSQGRRASPPPGSSRAQPGSSSRGSRDPGAICRWGNAWETQGKRMDFHSVLYLHWRVAGCWVSTHSKWWIAMGQIHEHHISWRIWQWGQNWRPTRPKGPQIEMFFFCNHPMISNYWGTQFDPYWYPFQSWNILKQTSGV